MNPQSRSGPGLRYSIDLKLDSVVRPTAIYVIGGWRKYRWNSEVGKSRALGMNKKTQSKPSACRAEVVTKAGSHYYLFLQELTRSSHNYYFYKSLLLDS